MADINNKLRLQIVSQLDAAGIKATKDEIDKLEQGVKNASRAGGEMGGKFGELEKKLGKLPGPLGDIGKALGGLAGKATMFIGAFKMGSDIGRWLADNVTGPLLGIKDPLGDLTKANAEHAKQMANLKTSLAECLDLEIKRVAAADAATERVIRDIDAETAAYLRQAATLDGIRKSQGNAEAMQLERQKFEDMSAYANAGYTGASEQIGKYYDVAIEELKAKQQIAEFDRESKTLTKELERNEQSYAVAAERVAAAKKDLADAEEELAYFREKNSVNGFYFDEASAKRDDYLEKVVDNARRSLDKNQERLTAKAAKLENVDGQWMQRQMDRANLAASGALAVDRAAYAYDQFVAANNNPLGLNIDPSWANEILKNSADADNTQKEILEVVRDFGDRLERLLEVK